MRNFFNYLSLRLSGFDLAIFLPFILLLEVLFVFGLLDYVLVPNLHKHHVNSLIFLSALRTFIAGDILKIQLIAFIAIFANPIISIFVFDYYFYLFFLLLLYLCRGILLTRNTH
jgi:hypothetical protein